LNILADEQQKLLDPCLSDEERVAKEKSYYDLYYKLRSKDETGFLGSLSLTARKRLHKLILFVYTMKNHLGGFSYEIIGDKREKTDRPIIFAVTHVGKFDIEVISEAIKDHYYLLSGDYEHIQGIIDAPFLSVNGVIYFNEKVKSDRVEVSGKMITHLKSGGNLMYFPEGTWNMTPNLPMLPCYWGIVEIAQKSNAIIVPIAADQYGKHFKINIGKNFDMNLFGNDADEKSRAIRELRDTLSALKYGIWESEPQLGRDSVTGNEWDDYINARFSEWPYFNLTYIDGLVFKPKGIISTQEAFQHLRYIEPNANNAFLFNKRLI
jgi:1-acyl-sn-glycerol-3-phosphate acyltransferase